MVAGGAFTAGALAEAVVDLDAIAHNTRILRSHTQAAVMAVVKANGFGHGAVPVARAALAAGAGWLGVSSVTEALTVRASGITAPVLAWMHAPGDDLAPAIGADIDLSVSAGAHLRSTAAAAEQAGRTASIHLKVDTGLHRNGAEPDRWPELVDAAAELERQGAVRVRGIWSHLVHPDDPCHPTTDRQLAVFDAAVVRARAAGLEPELLHVANSGAGLANPRAHYDLVRAGIGLYGVEPVRGRRFGLLPAMTLRARVIMVRRLSAGAGISYGHTYRTRWPSTIALVSIGFADGVPRAAAGAAQVLVAGARRPVAGTIAMDQFTVDLGPADVDLGEPVIVFGPGTHGEPTVAEWANWANTNPHELLVGVGPRVARRYLSDEGLDNG
jgi:alanine racemase